MSRLLLLLSCCTFAARADRVLTPADILQGCTGAGCTVSVAAATASPTIQWNILDDSTRLCNNSTCNGLMQDGGSVSDLNLCTKWSVGTNAASRDALAKYDGSFGGCSGTTNAFAAGTSLPTAAPDGHDSFVSQNTYTGTFAAGTWSFSLYIRCLGTNPRGHVNIRVWYSASQTCSGATEITGGSAVVGSTTTVCGGSTDTTSGTFTTVATTTVSAAYICYQIAWVVTTQGAAGNTINIRSNSAASYLISPPFTAG